MPEYNPGTLHTIARYVETYEDQSGAVSAVDVVVDVRRGLDLRWYVEVSVSDPWRREKVSADGYASLRHATDVAGWCAALRNRAKHGQTAAEYLAMIKAIIAEG